VIAEPLADLSALAGLRVLGVDDMKANRRIMSHYARLWGLDCDVEADALAALQRLRVAEAEGRPYRLVISDYQMPSIDGVMFAHAIREDPAITPPAFVLFTSLDRRLTPAELQELGISAVVMKPLRVGDLLNAVRRAVGMAVPAGFTRAPFPLKPAVAESSRQTMRVLVAEDNTVKLRVIALQLQTLGYAVDVAANGLEVLDALDRCPYRLLLRDCQMPEMDGYEATRRIRASSHRDIAIVALTANAMEGDRERCLEAGMDDYLSKPTRPADLAAVLKKFTPRAAA